MNRLEMLNIKEGWEGYMSLADSRKPADWGAKMQAAIDLIENKPGLPVHVWEYQLREALTTSDFPLLFADSLEREVRARYAITRPALMAIAKQRSVKDFRTVKSFRIDGATGRLQKVEEKGEYLTAQLVEDKKEYSVDKWGRTVDFSWEALINDDLGAFGDVAQRLADSCTNTLNYFITSLFFTAAGPTAASFGNAAAGTAPLSIGALETAVEAMGAYTDPNTAEPILNRPKYLMVGPALEFTARQILGSPMKMWSPESIDNDGTVYSTAYPTTNVISQYGLELIVNPWLPIVNTTNAATCWSLFSAPSDLPACEVGFLRGHEDPEIFMKAPDSMRVGGGLVSPFDGDFATDNVLYKVRYVLGGVVVETRASWASAGA